MLLFVYTTTHHTSVIFKCRYFKLSRNTTALSHSDCRNFSCSSISCLILPPCPTFPHPPPPRTNKKNVQMKLNLTYFGSVSVPLVTDFAGFELVDWNLPSMRPKHKTVLCSWHFTKLFCVTQQNVKTSKHEKKTDQKICSNQEPQEWSCCW